MMPQMYRRQGTKRATAATLIVAGTLVAVLLAFFQRRPTGEKSVDAASGLFLDREVRDSDSPAGAASKQSEQRRLASSLTQLDRSPAQSDPAGLPLDHRLRDYGSLTGAASSQPEQRRLASSLTRLDRSPPRSDPARQDDPTLDPWNLIVYGNRAFSTDQIKAAIRLPSRPTPTSVERSVREQVLSFYQQRGFVQARVSEAKASGLNPWTVELGVEEGGLFRLGRLEIHGVSALPAGDLLELYPQIGDVIDWPRLERANFQLLSRYRELGYLNVKVVPRAGTLPSMGEFFYYEVRVEEGPLYRVRSIDVPPGLQPTFPFEAGDPFLSPLLDQFAKSYRLGKEGISVDRFDQEGVVDISVNAGN